MQPNSLQQAAMANPLNTGQGIKHGRGYYIDPTTNERYIPEWYAYVINFNGITAGFTNDSDTIQIQADAEFLLYETTYRFINTAAPELQVNEDAIPDMTVLVTDSGSGRQLTNEPVQINSLFGTGRRPYEWGVPKRFAASSTIQVAIASTATWVNTYNLQLVFHGEKRFYLDKK